MKTTKQASAELYLFDEIDGSGFFGTSDTDVIDALGDIGDVDVLDVHINSGGGDVFAGVAIYEAIKNFPAKTRVHIDGLAASIASIIALAGDERIISPAGMVMVHPASGGAFGMSEDMRSMADVLDKITDTISTIYELRTNLTKEEALEMVMADNGNGTWMTAEEALEHGFATSISERVTEEVTNKELSQRITNAQKAYNAGVQNAFKQTDPPPEPSAKSEPKQPAQEAGFLLPKSKETPMDRAAQLRERIENATIAMENITNTADERGDDLTTSEVASINDYKNEIDGLQSQLEAVESVSAAKNFLNKPQGRKESKETATVKPAALASARSNTSTMSSPLRGDGRFTNGLAEFAKAVLENTARGVPDQRLDAIRNAETSFGTGGEGPSGGYAIPDDFRREILNNAIDQDPLISLARQIPTSGRSVTLTTREKQAWQSENIQSYTTAEGAAITRTTPDLKQVKIELHKTAALVPATEELLEDAPALANEILTVGAEDINFKLTNQLFRGTGVNEMLGVLNSPALVTVAKETAGSAQTADTINVENINNMYAAMPPRNRNRAVWVVAPNAETQLWKAAFHSPSGADPIGRAPGTMPNQPFGTLYGRPVIVHEVCNELGDLGDFFFLDLTDYAMPMKQGGIQTATSMHFAFDQGIEMFRMTIRAGGAPLWQNTISSRDGSFARSPFVTLAERS